MHDKALITEVRKRVSILEIKYEVLIKDLEVARGFLAMLERESMDDIVQQGPRTHAEIVGSAIADMLSRRPWMHRTDILNELLKRGVHVARIHRRRGLGECPEAARRCSFESGIMVL